MREWFWRKVALLLREPHIVVWLTRHRTPYADIKSADGSKIYMKRWWIFNPYDTETRRRRWAWLPISIRLHHILEPDDARDLHDHPWNARTFVLLGGYTEVRENGSPIVRWSGDTALLRYGEYHRIIDVDRYLGALTLFVVYRERGPWGFLVNGRKVPWHQYPEKQP